MPSLPTLHQASVHSQRVLVRVDFNVPLNDQGEVQEDTRVRESIPTLLWLLERGARVILLTHLGRPEGKVVEALRLDPLVPVLSRLLHRPVRKLDFCRGEDVKKRIQEMKEGDVLLLENIRFEAGEEENDPDFIKELATLGDLYVNDAFGTAHRAHASTEGLAHFLPSYAGFLLEKEVKALGEALEAPKLPLALIMGGAKIDTKIGILNQFLNKADFFLIGGGLANTFLAAEGYEVGASLYEPKKLEVAQNFLIEAENRHERVLLPTDVVVADEISEKAETLDVKLDAVTSEMKILDLGRLTLDRYLKAIEKAKTIIWNGPIGLFEYPPFSRGTEAIAWALARHPGITLLGGGDTIDALKRFNIPFDSFTHVSTGGGAMLEFLEGKELPGISALSHQSAPLNP